MQRTYIIIFQLFFALLLQSTDIKAQNEIAKKADSLFNANNYTDATKLFETLLQDKEVNKPNLYLKLAFINENQANYPKAIYYLNCFYNLKPSDEVFDKINKIALENKYSGFERSDLNFILLLYKQYNIYIIFLFVVVGGLILYMLYNKRVQNQKITFRNKIVMVIYIIYLLLLINIPTSFNEGIVKNTANLKDYPSAAAPNFSQISQGNKINIFGQKDIWYKAFYHRKIVYINKRDIWILPN